jgi:hypothetical protein
MVDTLLAREQGGDESYELSTECLRTIARSDAQEARSMVVKTGIRLLALIGNLRLSDDCQQCNLSLSARIHCLEGKLLCGDCGRNNRADDIGHGVYGIIQSALEGGMAREAGWASWEDALTFVQRQVTALSYPSYLEKASFSLGRDAI